MGICFNQASETSILTMTSAKSILSGALVAIFLLSFDSVKSECDCEGPVVDYCCPVGFNGSCCEYPLDRSAKSGGPLSPLEKRLKQLDEMPSMPTKVPEGKTNIPPPRKEKQLKQLEERQRPRTTRRPIVVPNITITEH